MKYLIVILFIFLFLPISLAQLKKGEATFIVSSIALYPVNDYTNTKQDLGLFGSREYLNVFWDAMYSPTNTDPIEAKCWLNCPYTDNIEVKCQGYQNCTYIGSTGKAACTIEKPVYKYTVKNNVTCIFYDPNSPEVVLPYAARNVLPLDFSLVTGGGSYSVGQTITWRVSVISHSLLESGYTINVTSYKPNIVYVQDGYGNTNSIVYGETGIIYPKLTFITFGTTTLEVLARPVEDPTMCTVKSNCPSVVYGTNPVCLNGVCWKEFEVNTMKATYASMPEYGLNGSIQIILVSAVVFSFLVFRKR